MCLDYREKFKINRHYGWKVFYKKNGILRFAYQHGIAKENEWLVSKSNQRYASLLEYPLGFHLYITKKDALEDLKEFQLCDPEHKDNFVVRKVLFEQVIITGYQRGWKVIVADRIKILPEGE